MAKKRQRLRLHILCEDRLTSQFVEYLADRWGIGPRQCRIDVSPEARGSGEQYVREHYVDAVDRWRAESHDASVALLVVIDGDKGGFTQRSQELAQLLRVAKRVPIGPKDRVVLLVPTWHIETWIAWLCGHRPLNQGTRYNGRDAAGMDVHRKLQKSEYTPKDAVDAWNPPAPDEPSHVPSLADARKELKQRIGV